MNNAPATFKARDGQTYWLAFPNTTRTALRDVDGLTKGEALFEYWITPDDDSERAYVALDFKRHTLDYGNSAMTIYRNTKESGMTNSFQDIARMMSNPSLLDIAETRKGMKAAIAKAELRFRVSRGDVDDLDFDRAADLLGLA